MRTRRIRIIPMLGVLMLMAACASVGNPGGGPRDEDPPRFVGSSPRPYSVNVTPTRVVIEFNEIVNVKDAFSKVTVSPVSKSIPRVSSQGRRVIVEFQDTLQPDVTYTIDFADAIEDNNEGNKLQGFTFSFATGAEIDSLRISGMVLGAQDLEPQQGMLVGIQSDLADSVFKTRPLERVARTDDRGRFTIRGLKPGTYRVFALGDNDNDYSHANPEEDMAFLDWLVVPSSLPVSVTDTVWNLKTGAVDTVVTRAATRFMPDDILLRSFTPDAAQLYLTKYERPDSTRLQVIMSRHSPAPARISLPGFPDLQNRDDWYVAEHSRTNDTLTYWLRDPRLISTDTLRVALEYLRTDTLHRLTPYLDSLNFITPRQRRGAKPQKKSEEELARDSLARLFLPFRLLSSSSHDINRPLILEFETPLARLDSAAIRLETKVDTVWRPVKKQMTLIRPDSLHPRQAKITYPWAYDTEYRLTVDTLAAEGILGRVTQPLSQNFKTKKEDDYCSLTLTLTDWPRGVPAFVELLNTSDSPVRTESVKDGKVVFRYLAPGKYYARVTEDYDLNGAYTTGDYDSLRLPERTFYYPKLITINKNWDKSETWEVFAVNVDAQKPRKLLKNKPAADSRKRQETEPEEEEEEIFDPTRNPFASEGRKK